MRGPVLSLWCRDVPAAKTGTIAWIGTTLLIILPPPVVSIRAKRFHRHYSGQIALLNRHCRGTTTVSRGSVSIEKPRPSEYVGLTATPPPYRFARGARNACLVGENPTFSVPALQEREGLRSYSLPSTRAAIDKRCTRIFLKLGTLL